MRKVDSSEDQFEEVGFDYRNPSTNGNKKESNGWVIIFVIAVSILFAYYFFDKTYMIRDKAKDEAPHVDGVYA